MADGGSMRVSMAELKKMPDQDRRRAAKSRPDCDSLRVILVDDESRATDLRTRADFYQHPPTTQDRAYNVQSGGVMMRLEREMDRDAEDETWYLSATNPEERAYLIAAFEDDHDELLTMIAAEIRAERDRRAELLAEADAALEAAELDGDGIAEAIAARHAPAAAAWPWSTSIRRQQAMDERYGSLADAVMREVMDHGHWSMSKRAAECGISKPAFAYAYQRPYEWALERWTDVRIRAFTLRA